MKILPVPLKTREKNRVITHTANSSDQFHVAFFCLYRHRSIFPTKFPISSSIDQRNFSFEVRSTLLRLLPFHVGPRVPMISSTSFQCLWFSILRRMTNFSGAFSITEASSPTEAGPARTGTGTAGRDDFIFRLSSSATACHGFWHDVILVLPSVLFVLYLGFHARSNIKKLSHRRSFVMIGYYGLLWFAVLLNLCWCFLQVLMTLARRYLFPCYITLDNSFTS